VARKVEVRGAGTVKIIQPWIAFLLAIVTLGLYYLFWYGIRNSELNDFGEAASPGPGILLFALALFLLPFEIAYGQHHLNRLWERETELESRHAAGAAPALG
jgi:hypothetical protein